MAFDRVKNICSISLSAVDNLWTPIPPKFDPEMKSHVDIMVNPRQSVHLRAFLECSAIPFEVGAFIIGRLLYLGAI